VKPSHKGDGSDQEPYVEVNEREIESTYREVPNSDSEFDDLLVGHAVMIEQVYHWERVVRTGSWIFGVLMDVLL
jgi:hypothetical protein